MKWADVPDDDTHTSLFITKLIERLDEILDDINKTVGITPEELEWISEDIKGWLHWKANPSSSS
jgi:hypothetical protein